MKKVWLVIGSLFLFVVGIGIGKSTCKKAKTKQPVNVETINNQKQKEKSESTKHDSIKQDSTKNRLSMRSGKVTIEIIEAGLNPKDAFTFAGIKFKITNKSSSVFNVNALNFTFKGSDLIERTSELAAWQEFSPILASTELVPGDAVVGWVPFKLAKNVDFNGVRFRYTEGLTPSVWGIVTISNSPPKQEPSKNNIPSKNKKSK